MRITKTMLLNDIISAKAELMQEGYQSNPVYGMSNDIDGALAGLQNAVAKRVVSRKDYSSNDDYKDAVNDYFDDGTNELCFVKRDSVLCTALMNFYSPNGTVKDFEKIANQNIDGFYSQMLGTDNSFDDEGFWFVAGSDYMDSLVPYYKQEQFLESINPNKSLKKDVIYGLTSAESDNITQLLDESEENLEERQDLDSDADYSIAINDLKSARNKLGL